MDFRAPVTTKTTPLGVQCEEYPIILGSIVMLAHVLVLDGKNMEIQPRGKALSMRMVVMIWKMHCTAGPIET